MRPQARLLAAAAIALLALSLATCISARQRDYVRYDEAGDEFHMLMLMEDIRVTEKDDLELLEATYRNRDHLIAPVIPGGSNIFIPFAGFSLLRTGDKQFSMLNIYASRPTDFETVDVAIPLDTVKIHAGAFFVEKGKLGFYQSISVPGKTVDLALVEISKQAQTDDLNVALQTEIDRRAKGGKIATWAEVKEQVIKQTGFKKTATQPATTEPAEEATLMPHMAMEADSLARLKAAVSAKSLKIERTKQMVKVSLPVSAKDAAGFIELYQAMIARTEELIRSPEAALKENAEDVHGMRSLVATLKPVAMTSGEQGLTAMVDLLVFTKAIEAISVERVDLNDKEGGAAAGPDPIAYLKGRGIAPSETITAEQVVRDFNAGMLKAFPSEVPVKPGAGVVGPK